jgi:hypothetical protein
MIMNDVKPWYMSKGVWGGLIAMLAAILGDFGYALGADDQVALADIALSIGGALGGLLAIYGRVKASKGVK